MHPEDSTRSPPESDAGDAKRQGTQNTNSMVSAVNSANAIEALKGRIIATHKLLKYLDTARKDLQNEKDRTTAFSDQVKQLESDRDQAKQALVNRDMYAKQLEAAATDRANIKKTEGAETGKLKKELATLKQTKDSLQTSYRSLQDENIKLKRERDVWKKEQEDFEEEKMERSIDYEMLQSSLTEARDEVSALKQKVIDLEHQLAEKNTVIATHQSASPPQPVSLPIQPVQPHHHHAGLLAELQKYVEENSRLLHEKRVLQDRFTDQLVVNADMEAQLRQASLARFLPGTSDTSSPSKSMVLSPRANREEMLEEIRRTPEASHFKRIASAESPTSPRQPRSYPPVATILPSSPSAIVPSAPVSKASRLIPPAPQVAPPAKKPQATKSQGPKTKLEKLAGMRLSGISRKRANEDPIPAPARPTKKPSVQATPLPPIKALDDCVNKLLKLPPTEAMPVLSETARIIAKLRDPKDKTYTDPLFKSIASLFKELKSYSNPTSKNSGTNLDLMLYGIPGGIHILCPSCVITQERNLAWAMYAYYSLHGQELFPKFTEWAMSQTMENLKASKTGVACRYIRMLTMIFRQTNDRNRMHIFCYDVARTIALKDNIVFPMLNVALLWPDVLTLNDTGIAGSQMVVKAIQSACAAHCLATEDGKGSLLLAYEYFTQFCGWPILSEAVPLQKRLMELTEVLLSEEFKQIAVLKPDAFTDLRFNLIKSFELIYYRLNSWQSTYNGFVIQVLWPLMRDAQLADTCLELMAVVVQLGIVSKDLSPRRGRPSHPKESDQQLADIESIRQKFVQALGISSDCPEDEFELQITSAKGLLLLSSGDISRIMPVIDWYQKTRIHFSKRLPAELDKVLSKLTAAVKSTLTSTHSL